VNIISNENLYIPSSVNKYEIIKKLTGSAATGELKDVTFETFFIGITGVYNLVASKNSNTKTGGSNKFKTHKRKHKKRDKKRQNRKTMKSKNIML
jgi:hypothetical protein